MALGRTVLLAYTLALLAFLYAPIVALVISSFNSSKYIGRWEGFTVRWYLELLNDEDVIRAAINSFVVALLPALISTCLGALAAYYSARMGSSSLDPVFYVPIVIPEIAEAFSLLLLFCWAGVELGFLTVLIGHTAYNVAYAYVALKP